METFWVGFDNFALVMQDATQNPSKVLNPAVAWSQSDVLYFEFFLLIMTYIWTYGYCKFNDWSAVDRIWSISPIIYSITFLIHSFYHNQTFNQRHLLITALITMWGVRLTANFAVKGGYSEGGEDYRWEYVRAWFKDGIISYILKELFLIGFLNWFQNTLIWAFSNLPMYLTSNATLINHNNNNNNTNFDLVKVNSQDIIITIIWLVLFAIEIKADLEMLEYQNNKQKYKANKKSGKTGGAGGDKKKNLIYERGFYCNGLYGYCRHPNYFGEIGMWYVLCFYSTSMYGGIVHWSIIGAIILHTLFFGSIDLGEKISSSKYKEYKIYQQRVPMLILSPFAQRMD